MRTHFNLFLFASILGFLSSCPPSCVAANFRIQADNQAGTELSSVSSGDAIQLEVSARNSYCCEIVSRSGADVNFGSTQVDLSGINATGGNTIGRFAGLDEPRYRLSASRLCFTAPANIDLGLATLTISVSGGGPASDNTAKCSETTLYGGFNTSVTDFNFLEISNTLDSVTTDGSRIISGSITARNTVPEPDTIVINQAPFTVNPESRVDIDVHTSAGLGAFGPVKISHNGAPGAIKAVLNQYNITSSNPLRFAPVAQELFRSRAELAGGTK